MQLRRTAFASAGWLAATLASIGVAYLALHPLLATAVPDEVVDLPPVAGLGVPSTTPWSSPPPPSVPPSATPVRQPTQRPSTTVQDGWTVTTGPGGAKTYLRSFRVLGGDTVIQIAGGQVSLVTATPRTGYRVEPQQTRPDRIAVYFVGVGRASIVDVMWYQGAPRAEVTESGKNG